MPHSIASTSRPALILCVDDDSALLKMLEWQIRQYFSGQVAVESAESGEEALELLADFKTQKRTLSILISDEVMKGMKGHEFLIGAHQLFPEAAKILLTGQSRSTTAIELLVQQVNLFRFLRKPWDPLDLKLTIAGALQIAAQQTEFKLLRQQIEEYRNLSTSGRAISQEIDRNSMLQRFVEAVKRFITPGVLVLFSREHGQIHVLQIDGCHAGLTRQYRQRHQLQPLTLHSELALQTLSLSQQHLTDPYRICLSIYNTHDNNGLFLLLENPKESQPIKPIIPDGLQMLAAQLATSIRNANLFNELQQQNLQFQRIQNELKNRNEALGEAFRDVTDSIDYAQRIQQAMLPNVQLIQSYLSEVFITYWPRDMVSGDFYWFYPRRKQVYLAVADCTGHGVPGALLTTIGYDSLNYIIRDFADLDVNFILSELNERITSTLNLRNSDNEINPRNEGMDISLVRIDFKTQKISFAGANRPIWFFSKNKEFQDIRGTSKPIGSLLPHYATRQYVSHSIDFSSGDMLYLFTDGIVDQFGSKDAKRFSSRRLKELLESIHHLPMAEQKNHIEQAILNWRGNRRQTDDITMVGVRL